MDVTHNIIKRLIDKNAKPYNIEVKHVMKVGDGQTRINPMEDSNYCGSCYGAGEYEHQCCNTCDDVHRAYHKKLWKVSDDMSIEQCLWTGQYGDEMKKELQRGDGCHMFGFLEVNKVAGNFHFA